MNKNFERGMTEQFTVHLHLCENPLLHKEERRGNFWLILEIVDETRECKIPINFQLRNSVLHDFQTSKPELITDLRFY